MRLLKPNVVVGMAFLFLQRHVACVIQAMGLLVHRGALSFFFPQNRLLPQKVYWHYS